VLNQHKCILPLFLIDKVKVKVAKQVVGKLQMPEIFTISGIADNGRIRR